MERLCRHPLLTRCLREETPSLTVFQLAGRRFPAGRPTVGTVFLVVRRWLTRRVLKSPQPDLIPDVVGRNRECRWKEVSVHVPNLQDIFVGTEAERKHVRRSARFQQHRDANCHQVFFPTRQGAEGNSRHSDRNVRGICTIVSHLQKLGDPV